MGRRQDPPRVSAAEIVVGLVLVAWMLAGGWAAPFWSLAGPIALWR